MTGESAINRHKSTRWVQTSETSYGDDWGEMSGSEEGSGPETVDDSLALEQGTKSESKRVSRFVVTNPDASGDEDEGELSELMTQSKDDDPVVPEEVGAADEVQEEVVDDLESVRDGKVSEDIEKSSEPGQEENSVADISGDSSGDVSGDISADVSANAPADISADISSDSPADTTGNMSSDIEPTKPLNVRSRKSSRNPSVNLDENQNDILSSPKLEKLKSKDYSNISSVMEDYLTKRDSQFYKPDEEQVKHHLELSDLEENDQVQDENSVPEEDDIDHVHRLSISSGQQTGEKNTFNVSETPNDYSLARSLSSGSLSTGSWSLRSSAHVLNGSSSARDSFLAKVSQNERKVSSSTYNDVESVNEGAAKGAEDPYYDSSDEDNDSLNIRLGQSINFGHWRPNTSSYRNAFIKDVRNNDMDSILPSIEEEEEEDPEQEVDEDDDAYSFDDASFVTDQSSLQFSAEELHFRIKPLDTLDDSPESNRVSTLDPLSRSIAYDDTYSDSNATETEVLDDTKDEINDEDEDTTDIEDSSTSSVAEDSSKQRYTSLLGLETEKRQASVSSSIPDSVATSVTATESRAVSGTTPRIASAGSELSSLLTVLAHKATKTKNFTPLNMKSIQLIGNSELRIAELRRLRQEEIEVYTGLQDWLTTELANNINSQDTYDQLGPIALNAYKQLTPTTHLHGHSVTDMITRRHSINFGNVVGHGRLKLKNKVGDHGGNLAKGIFNRGKKMMRNGGNE